MLDEIENLNLLKMAEKRLPYNEDKLVSQETLMEMLGISQDDLEAMDDIELE